MGILESISAMGIGKLVVLGILSLVVGIPVLILLAVTIISVICGPFALWNPPWKGGRVPASPRQPSQTRILSFGIVLLAIGAGIISLAYVLERMSAGIDKSPLVLGGLLLFGGLGLIISYIVVSRIEKRQKEE